ncbi:hypothetical protein JTE90_013957 [Oedothorax gibbosus]|uniref:Integrase catalytic domain-containing protein n=1 Tax=Oedothorax gibbosus TaxID=931172 RepID=A0AAV6UFK3_9ARAC|nr:hypothetical protein JTE90_013957 [Oedothorax gibbosus]
MKKTIKLWVQTCEQCQRSKVQRHTNAPLGPFALPDARFYQVHIDPVGPLPLSNGHIYILTMIDSFTRWPEAVPIPDTKTTTLCIVIFETWISRFGCPTTITTDRRAQMRPALYQEFCNMLGTNRLQTTAYHPISNGIIERFHRHLKASIKAHENSAWSEVLPVEVLSWAFA